MSLALVKSAQGAATNIATDPYARALAYQVLSEGVSYVGQSLKTRKKNKKKNKNFNNMSLPMQISNKAPVFINTRASTRKPRMRGTVKGGISITHREYIGEVTGSTTFLASSYAVQPGISETFPWLHGIANNFEKYKIKSMTLEFINVSATSERGRVTLAFDHDPLDSNPIDKVQLFSYKGAVEGAVWAPLKLRVPVPNKEYFTRNGIVTGTDLKTYDIGKFVVGTSNNADAAIIGELFVSYEIELSVPQPATCPSITISGGGTVSKSDIFGSEPVQNGNFPITVEANSLVFNTPGFYVVSLRIGGTTPGLMGLAVSGSGALSAITSVTDGSGSGYSCAFFEVWVKLRGASVDITIPGTSVNTSYCRVTTSNGNSF